MEFCSAKVLTRLRLSDRTLLHVVEYVICDFFISKK